MQAVLDIGKTHIKLLVVEGEKAVASFSCKNAPISGMYPQADVASIWHWLGETLRSCQFTEVITSFVVTTHGATAALINATNINREDALVLPILDYEFTGIDSCESDYQTVRPDFAQTLSPALPAGLNLGKQLFWLQNTYKEEFAQTTHILMYPQYWIWRLGGDLAMEVTSLGCHTDLWNPGSAEYSSLVSSQQWLGLMPPMHNAWDCVGQVSSEAARHTGLSTQCKLYVGVHDSNASFLRYLAQAPSADEGFTVISSGTWTILMQARGDVSSLANSKDTLANVDIEGNPVACARFMGGREYETICARLGGNINMTVATDAIQKAIDNSWMVTPDFSGGNGPFGGSAAKLLCPAKPEVPAAIATLYCALMIDQRLSDLNSVGDIYIEGAFLKNPLLCGLVAQLRPRQQVKLSADNTGTVMGASALIGYNTNEVSEIALTVCPATHFDGLADYRTQWYEAIMAK